MSTEKIKSDLLKLIKTKKGVSYVEIENFFEENNYDYKGTESQYIKDTNIILWGAWNPDANEMIEELLNDKLITITPTPMWVYLVDGKILDIPLYKGRKSKSDRWLPVEFN